MSPILRPATRAARLAVAIALCAGWTASAEAVPITFEFTGTVTEVQFKQGDPYSGAIDVGTTFSGRLTFESSATDEIPEPQVGLFTSPSGFRYGFEISMGGQRFDFYDRSKTLFRDNVDLTDLFGAIACSQQQTGVCEDWQTVMYLADLEQTAWDSAELRAFSLPFDVWELALIRMYGNGYDIAVAGDIESFACVENCGPDPTPVPEPGTLALLGSALGWLGSRRTRRNQA